MKTTMTRNLQTGRRDGAAPNGLFASGARRIARVLMASALLLSGCNEKHDPDAEPSMTVTPAREAITFDALGTEDYTFTVTTNQPVWLAVSDQTWCKVAVDYDAGTFTVTAEPNDQTTAPPAATIIVSAGRAGEMKITATQAAARYDLYVAGGYTHETDGDRACCWINGKRKDLPIPADMYQGQSLAMTVDNGSVYVSGAVDNRGCYWKDGEYFALKDPDPGMGSAPSYPAHSIAVDNGTVYALGYDYLWTNNVPTKISNQGFTGYGLDAAGGNYCIVGSLYVTLGPIDVGEVVAIQGGTALSIDASSKDSRATCVRISDGSVYAGGHYFDKTKNRVEACSWKDGKCTPLDVPQGTVDTSVRGICAADGKVYTAGYHYDGTHGVPCYWVDGKRTDLELPYATAEAYAEDITVADGKVYVAGYYKDATDWPYRACYWVDGKRTDIEKEPGMIGLTACGIAWVKK